MVEDSGLPAQTGVLQHQVETVERLRIWLAGGNRPQVVRDAVRSGRMFGYRLHSARQLAGERGERTAAGTSFGT